MIGPKKRPQEFGLKPTEHHLIINDFSETCKVFRGDGTPIRILPALAKGQLPGGVYSRRFGDTPPGLYVVGQVWRDLENESRISRTTKQAYGWYTLDLVELEGQESRYGRSGIAIHGGGTALGWPRAWDPNQPLLPTQGCVRMHNHDLKNYIVPLLDSGRIFVSVYQDK